jgi:hypothetical protein
MITAAWQNVRPGVQTLRLGSKTWLAVALKIDGILVVRCGRYELGRIYTAEG